MSRKDFERGFDKAARLAPGQSSTLTPTENAALLDAIRKSEKRLGPTRRLNRWLAIGKLPPEMRDAQNPR